MKNSLGTVLVIAIALLVWWFGPVDFAGAETVFAGAADGKALSVAPTLNRRGGAKRRITSPAPSLLLAQSLRDIVIDSEGGKIPEQREVIPPPDAVTPPQKEGGGTDPRGANVPRGQYPPSPLTPDAGGPGGALVPAEPGPLLSAWGFVAWLPDGRLVKSAGGLFDDADTCAQARAARRRQAPTLRLSPCTQLQTGEPERL